MAKNWTVSLYSVHKALSDNTIQKIVTSSEKCITYEMGDHSYAKTNQQRNLNLITNLNLINNYGGISRNLKKINAELAVGGLYIGKFKTHDQIRATNWMYKIPVLKHLYKVVDFGVHRVAPKIKPTQKIYFFLTKGKRRRLTKAEVLGRLVRYGFQIEEVNDDFNGETVFVARKVNEGRLEDKPSFGPLYRMPRIGKDGKMIHVFKLRTMHPYSEYLQDYVLQQNGYSESGKPANDFRLTSWGKVARKYWLDEVPQLINVVRGDMKLLGVRPVSRRYFEDIPEHLQFKRLSQKPGCIPPYVALNRASSKNAVLNAEEVYLRLAKGNTVRLDTSLAFMALRNIVFKGKRSA